VGRERWFAGFDAGNLFGTDQVLSFQYATSIDFRKFQAYTGKYTIPLSWRHILTFFGGYAEVKPSLDPFSSKGESIQASARYDIPLGCTYKDFLNQLTIGFDFKRANNRLVFLSDIPAPIENQNVNLTQFLLSYENSLFSPKNIFSCNADFFFSPAIWIKDQQDDQYSIVRAGAKSRYAYGKVTLRDILTLPGRLTLHLQARAQVASCPLLPSEQYGLGGFDTVRGYFERIILADDVVIGNVELRSPKISFFKKAKDRLEFLVFMDYAWGRDIDRIPPFDKNNWLWGVGPGVRYEISNHVLARLDWGVRLHTVPNINNGDKTRFHFAVLVSF
jgi:hemolysin activation/secretion protein